MSDMVGRLIWFTIVAAAISYASYLYVGSVVNAQAQGSGDPIVIRDALGPNSHNLSGIVTVPATCDQLIVRTETLSVTTYLLDFETWREPSVPCTNAATPRWFHAILFAPATGVDFTASLDGTAFPIAVIPVIVASSTP